MKKLLIAIAGALAVTGFVTVSAVNAAPAPKVDVCHYDADADTYHLISISENAYEKHLDHGDGNIDGPVPGLPGFVFDAACEIVPEPVTEVLLGRAWVDQNADHVYNEGDALIAEMFQDPDTGLVRLVTDKFPTSVFDENVEELANFQVKEHTGGVATYLANANTWSVTFGAGGTNPYLVRLSDASNAERYAEFYTTGNREAASAIDSTAVGGPDRVIVDIGSPSMPDVASNILQTTAGTGDNFFIDSEVFPPAP